MIKVTDIYRYIALFILAIFLLLFSYDISSIEPVIGSGIELGSQKYSADYFSANYQEARLKFQDAARSNGGRVESYENPTVGPNKEPLFTDVAIFGPENPVNILVLSSGMHGVEGFAGSAMQTGLLKAGVLESLGPDTGLVLVHAVNPYGFAHLRRMNEDNVDLNRNFLDHSLPHPQNPGYEELAKSIAPESINLWSDTKARLHFFIYRIWHDADALRTAISKGQYTHPLGLFYGGLDDAWSNKIIRTIAKQHLANAKRMTAIDFHTGLGPYGETELRMNVPKNSPEYLRAIKCWSDPIKTTDPHGSFIKALPGMMPETDVTAATLEFGTFPSMDVLWALREENWLHHHGNIEGVDSQQIKKNLLEAFYPSDEYWKELVWQKGKIIVDKAIECLKHDEFKRQ